MSAARNCRAVAGFAAPCSPMQVAAAQAAARSLRNAGLLPRMDIAGASPRARLEKLPNHRFLGRPVPSKKKAAIAVTGPDFATRTAGTTILWPRRDGIMRWPRAL